MLLRFHCKNFRSFRDKQEISLVAAKTRSDERDNSLIETPIKGILGLRCAAIYGANASGKTNILRALSSFRSMIASSQKNWDETDGIPNWDPFRLDETSGNAETEFEADVLIDSVRYRYGFRFNRSAITDEWLVECVHRERTLFRRRLEEGRFEVEFPGRNLTGSTLETIKQLTRSNSLFLSAAAQNNFEKLRDVHKWFTERFWIVSPGDESSLKGRTSMLCKEDAFKEKVKELIRLADVGVVDVEVAEEEYPENTRKAITALFRAMKESGVGGGEVNEPSSFTHWEPAMKHKGAEGRLYTLTDDEESAGTLRYFSIIGPILSELADGSILLIDELESSLHPLLARGLVEIFNSESLNPKGAQVIFTTHNTGLLEREILRRDQIWFTEKNEDGASSLYPLSDFKPRKEQNIAAGYLHGRFGAVPFLDSGALESVFRFDEKDKDNAYGG
jgi:hypothetical protein